MRKISYLQLRQRQHTHRQSPQVLNGLLASSGRVQRSRGVQILAAEQYWTLATSLFFFIFYNQLTDPTWVRILFVGTLIAVKKIC